jgi:NTE family protein
LARADVVIRPRVNDIGPADFEQRNNAIMEGEKAALAALPQIRARLARIRQARVAAVAARVPVQVKAKCDAGTSGIGKLLRREPACATATQ